jgi:hypothetical protein
MTTKLIYDIEVIHPAPITIEILESGSSSRLFTKTPVEETFVYRGLRHGNSLWKSSHGGINMI